MFSIPFSLIVSYKTGKQFLNKLLHPLMKTTYKKYSNATHKNLI